MKINRSAGCGTWSRLFQTGLPSTDRPLLAIIMAYVSNSPRKPLGHL